MRRTAPVLALLFLLSACATPRDVVTPPPPPPVTAPQAPPSSADDRPALSVEDIWASGTFAARGFQGGRWTDSGPVVTYIERDANSSATHLMSYNLQTDQRERLIDGRTLRAPDVDRLVAIEDYQYSADGGRVLIYTDSERVWRQNTKGYYYVYDLGTQALTPLASRDAGFQMFAKFSPAGRHVAFVRDRNLFLVDLDTTAETQLTFNGGEGTVINGTFDWVYEEEFGLRDGFSWSPDGRYIAFFQLDETNTRDFFMADLRGQYPEAVRFRYPKAGEVNAEVRVGVIDVALRDTRFFDTDTWNEGGDETEYIAQMGWTPARDGAHHVYMMRLDRDQNDLDLLYGDPTSMALQTVLQESEPTWIDVFDGKLTYLEDGAHFVWRGETSGYDHLHLYRNDGTYVRHITTGAYDVTDFHGVDEAQGVVYFTATAESPLERHLYRLPLTGTGAPTKITRRTGTHNINMSADLAYYIDAFSTITTPSVVSLHRADGTELKVLQDNAELEVTLAEYGLRAPEFMTVPGADGTALNAYVIKPSTFDPTRAYPMLMHIYGGPGAQEVRDAWGGAERLWHHLLAEEYGIVVVGVDNRGTGGRGKAFKSQTYKKLGLLEAEDHIAAAQWFGRQPWVDADRMGVWGWSYGGFMTLLDLTYGQGPETFKLGISVAPVTDWGQYDTIYTERYMSTPQRNARGYELTAPTRYADRLRDDQHLLLVHGDFDDNVHFQNAVQMMDALQAANKQFDLMVYPGRNHGIFGGNTRLHLYTMMTNYLLENLVGSDRPAMMEMGGR